MTTTQSTIIWCDSPRCQEYYPAKTGNPNKARQLARAIGWLCVAKPDDADYCPRHAKERM